MTPKNLFLDIPSTIALSLGLSACGGVPTSELNNVGQKVRPTDLTLAKATPAVRLIEAQEAPVEEHLGRLRALDVVEVGQMIEAEPGSDKTWNRIGNLAADGLESGHCEHFASLVRP